MPLYIIRCPDLFSFFGSYHTIFICSAFLLDATNSHPVCWVGFDVVPFDCVVVGVVVDSRVGRALVVDGGGEDVKGSDLTIWDGEAFPPDT